MSPKLNDPILRDWDDKYPSLMNLPLNRIYGKINQYFSSNRHDSTICRSSLSELSSNYALLLSICNKVDNILKMTIYNVSLLPSVDVNKYCEYLSYFLYVQIINNNINSYSDELYGALNKAKVIYGLNDCNIINFDISKEQFDKKKELYIHSELLNSIKNKHTTYNSYDSSIFTKYFNECVNSYKKIVQNNNCKEFENYEKELDNFINNFKETKNILEGKNITIFAEDISLIEKPTCTSEKSIATLEPKEAVATRTDHETVSTFVSSNTETAQMEPLVAGTDITPGLIFGIIDGIFFLSLIFYKFTPFGSSLHHKIGSIKNKFNLEVKNKEFIEDTFDNTNMNMYDDMYHIQYQSSQNS
ncbi:PIR Superfamily Protein [Plasmodium ovale curtisi]|uniref:PIR Superfamily Protein n=1 Tax=Plasmodium ovale curtisi TaxID=864141 RepID=A0A1A8X9M8_PLAOA|nr:PIR Superfamily Protein [Plasmodium ovale curtisi]